MILYHKFGFQVSESNLLIILCMDYKKWKYDIWCFKKKKENMRFVMESNKMSCYSFKKKLMQTETLSMKFYKVDTSINKQWNKSVI